MIQKVAIRVGILLPLLLLVGYLLRRFGGAIGLGLGGKRRGKLDFGVENLLDMLNNSDIVGSDTYQAGCPTVEDILEAYDNGAYSYAVTQQWAMDNGFPPTTTWACNTAFPGDTTLTQNMCGTVVLEVRNRLVLGWGMDAALPDDVFIAELCLLDSNLWAMMESVASPTVNGFKLYQFCNYDNGVSVGTLQPF